MQTSIRIDPPGVLKEVRTRFDSMGTRARQPEHALKAPGTLEDLKAGERRRFDRRFSPADSRAWVARKRREGLDHRTLRATGKLEQALTSASSGVSLTAFNGVLTWGIRGGRSDVYYAAPLAKRHRSWRVVVIDKPAKQAISHRIERYIVDGTLT